MATWVGYPLHYAKGRNRPVQYVVIHSTQGSEGPTSAEAGAAYDKRRPDSVSTHIFVDSNSAVREVPDTDRAYHARYHGNEVGLGIELCGLAQQSGAQWHDASSLPMLRIAAVETAQMCCDHGLPARRLSVAQVRAAYYAPAAERPKGICGHVDVTAAYPEDDGSHWDPGPNFPWTEFLAMVQAEMDGDDMPTAQEIALAVWGYRGTYGGVPVVGDAYKRLNDIHAATAGTAAATAAKLDAILAAALDDGDMTVVLPPDALGVLTELRDAVAALPDEAEVRDAVADLGEGGAAQVRADTE